MKPDPNPLEKDLAEFNKQLPELQQKTGKYAVFIDGTLLGIFDTTQQAFENGYAKAGLKPFLVRQITAIPVVQHFSRAVKFRCLTSS
jgi:hypothetical protein